MKMKRLLASLATAVLVVVGLPGMATAAPQLELPPGVTASEYKAMKAKEKSGQITKGKKALKALPGIKNPTKLSALSTTTIQYQWAGASQTVSNTGAYANLNISDNYYDDVNDAHTLTEIAVIRNNGSGGGRDAVEIGWGKGGWCATSTNPCLFGFTWDNDVPTPLGYNGGFVDYAPNTVDLGDDVSVTPSGCNSRFGIQEFNDDWWLHFEPNSCSPSGDWLGYFPQSRWANGTIFDVSNQVQFFGEVPGFLTPGDPNEDGYGSSDMGNGTLATASVGQRIGTAQIIGIATSAVNLSPFASSQGAVSPSPGRYEAHVATGSVAGNVRTIRYGGPGYAQTSSAAGITGG